MDLPRALLILAMPFISFLVHWAAWHFNWDNLSLPLALMTIATPAAFAIAGSFFLRGFCLGERRGGISVSIISFLILLIAYAWSFYALENITHLIIEIYKFDIFYMVLSRSTVQLWAYITGSCAVACLTICRIFHISTRACTFARATLGMIICTTSIFIPFLLSPYVNWRA